MMTNHNKLTKQQGSLVVKRLQQLLWWLSIGFLIYMPLHIFLAQSLSLITGGLDIWKVAKDVLLLSASLLGLYLAWPLLKSRRDLKRLAWLVVGYGALHLVFIAMSDLHDESAWLATTYNNRLFMLLALGIAAGYLFKQRLKQYEKVLLVVTSAVAAFGLVQYFLPAEFMENLGYSIERGTRAFFGIDDKADLPRAFSTVRDPNSLGAMLIVSISLIGAYFMQAKSFVERRKWLFMGLLQGVVLLLTFSRSAWLGAALVLVLVAWQTPKVREFFSPKRLLLVLCCLFLAALLLFPAVRGSYLLENIVFHSDESTTEVGSTEKHFNIVADSAREVINNPLGHGPGTAGLVSIRNPEGTNLTENYYLQIGYEVGILGLGLFLALNWLTYVLLLKSAPSPLRSALIASFWGLVITNMLLHTWSNEAVATLWWLSAGYVIGSNK